jgi:hypothetical protein
VSESEARRLDLYNALSETLGPERADTLMAHLPSREATDLATRADINALKTRMERLQGGIDSVNLRLDRLFLTLAAGLVAMITAVFAQAFA